MNAMSWVFLVVAFVAVVSSFYFEFQYRIVSRRLRQQEAENRRLLDGSNNLLRLGMVNGIWRDRPDSRGRKSSKVFRVEVPVDPDFIDYTTIKCSFLASEVEEARKRDEVIFGKEGK